MAELRALEDEIARGWGVGGDVEVSFPTAPMRSLLDAAHKAALLESEGEVWTLNLDQIESHSGKVLAKVMLDRKEVGPSTYVFNKGTVLYCKLRPT